MRAWILAAAAALGVGQAGAATYELTYRTYFVRFIYESPWDWDDYQTWRAPDKYWIKFLIELPSADGINLGWDSSTALPPVTYSEVKFRGLYFGDTAYEWPGASYDLHLATNADGKISSVAFGLSDSGNEVFITNSDGAYLPPAGNDEHFVFTGKWVLKNLDASPVPLPATAPLLGGAMGLAWIARRIRSAGRSKR